MLTVYQYLENEKGWANAAAMLISSLRRRATGGDVAFVVLFSSDSDGESTNVADDCSMVGRRHFGIYPSFNKVRIVEHAAQTQAGESLLLDHDIIAGPAVRRLLDRPQPEFGAVENSKSQLESAFGMRVAGFIESWCGESIEEFSYFNTGVVSMTETGAVALAETWPEVARAAAEQLAFDSKPRPYANLTMSVAAAHCGLARESYPPEFNQRNYGDLPTDPVLIHYNNWDAVNVEVKTSYLHDLDRLSSFLDDTDNRFWQAYASHFREVLEDPQTQDLADAIWRRMSG